MQMNIVAQSRKRLPESRPLVATPKCGKLDVVIARRRSHTRGHAAEAAARCAAWRGRRRGDVSVDVGAEAAARRLRGARRGRHG